jgi:beta-galactosidase
MTLLMLMGGILATLRAADLPWDTGWRFHLGEAAGAEAAKWDDAGWRQLELPHDWSIEGATDPHAPTKGDGGFFPTGIGWYRKTFTAPEAWRGKRVGIEFDGVYRNSEVWINGTSLGRRPSGFSRFAYDLTPHLRLTGDNAIAVRVDNSAQPNSRWYAGSGIYRHVRLRILDPVHLAPDSFVATTTSLATGNAEVHFAVEVRNTLETAQEVSVEIVLIDPAGRSAGVVKAAGSAGPGATLPLTLTHTLADYWPWSPASPSLYRAVSRVTAGGRLTDHQEHRFGIRTVSVSAERGFELNGMPLKLLGGNAHDDNGPLGVAAFDRAEERRVEQLKAAGFNAVRTAHNPPAPAFLEACDRLGLLVICEAFDGWKNKKLPQDYGLVFDGWAERDLDAMIRTHRNHPSVVMWSIGNEPYERGSESGVAIAKKLADRARALDPSRPVTAGINGLGKTRPWSGTDPVLAPLDVAGYNYEIAHHAEDHVRLPQRVIFASESYHGEVFTIWSIMQAKPYVIGDFIWSAIDYLGEAGIGRVFPPDEAVRPHWVGSHYPWHGAACGDIDLTGWRRPSSHYRNIVWARGEKLYAAVRELAPDGRALNVSLWAPPPLQAHWNWPEHAGRELLVEVYSRHEAVRLYLNDKLLGEKPTTQSEEFKAVFVVPYVPGALRAVGLKDGREVETFTLATAGAPTQLRLTADRTALKADGQDLAFVTVEVLDAAGRVVPHADASVTYTLTGPGTLAGIGSGDLTTTESYRANPRRVFQGRALVVVRTTGSAGELMLTANANALKPATAKMTSIP